MFFILNKMIKYTPDTSELSIINEQQNSITLSKSADRLLSTLIHNANIVVSRDSLLKNVWEEYGYTPSNNNLYMAISELRKAFISLGNETEILKTIPKVGLKLETSIDILTLSNDNNQNSDTGSIQVPEKIKKRYYFDLAQTVLSVMLIILSIAYYNIKLKNSFTIVDSQYEHIFKYGACDILSNNQSDSESIIKFRGHAIAKLNEYSISCDNKNRTIYFQTLYGRSLSPSETFIGVCSGIKKGIKRECETIAETYG